MPLNCPLGIPRYNYCATCRHRSDDECSANALYPIKLKDILTLDERLALIEDRPEMPSVTDDRDYQSLRDRLLLLEEKLNSHIDKTAKPKSQYS